MYKSQENRPRLLGKVCLLIPDNLIISIKMLEKIAND